MRTGYSNFVEKPLWLRLIVTILLVAAALGMTEMIWLIVDRPISSPLFLGSIMLTAWLCGSRCGFFAAVLSAFVIDFFFVPPTFQFTGEFDEVARLILFTAEGSALSWLIEVRRDAVEEIKNTGEKLRALTVRQQSLRETEQKRIALEIHDELGQALTGLKMEVHWLNRTIDERPGDVPKQLLTDKLGELLSVIDTTISSVRRIVTEIRPSVLDDFGLVAAIEWQAKEFERKSGVECLFSADSDLLDLHSDANTAVFRIFQEALTNVARHSHASRVSVDINLTDRGVVMDVEDNGVGIESKGSNATHSLGILGMQERARLIGATLDITRGTAGGTLVRLALPDNGGLSLNGGSAA